MDKRDKLSVVVWNDSWARIHRGAKYVVSIFRYPYGGGVVANKSLRSFSNKRKAIRFANEIAQILDCEVEIKIREEE